MKNLKSFVPTYINLFILSVILVISDWSCNEPPFPRIESIEPAQGQVGDFVRIKGAHLDYRNSFYFGDYLIPPDSISGSNKELNFRVPNGFNSGLVDIYIVTEEEVSNSVTFTILPSILNLSPTSAGIGEEIIIETNYQVNNLEVFFAEGINATEISQIDEYSAKITVPDGATSGSIEFRSPGNEPQIFPSFIVKKAPKIEKIEPSWGWPGREITISGMNFLEGETEIQFATGQVAEITSMDFNQVKVLVPQAAGNGLVWVNNPYGQDSVEFVISASSTEAPFVSQIIPNKISPGCEMTIIGGNFDPENTTISFEGENGRITAEVKASEISEPRNKITLSVPKGVIKGDVTLSTMKGMSDPVFMDIVDLPQLKRVFPERNVLGGQIILDVDHSQSVSRLFFGSQPVEDTNGAFERFQFNESGNEIIATNVPLNFSSTNTEIFLEVAEGCYSNRIAFEVETNKIAPNAPIPGGPHTVIIPAATAGLTNINNDWTAIEWDFNEPQQLRGSVKSFFLCGCTDPDGNVMIYDYFEGCKDQEMPECIYSPEFLGRDPVGILWRDGTIEIYNKWYGRVVDDYLQYGAKGMILTSMEYGNQVEFNIPNFITDGLIKDKTIGDSITINGSFAPQSALFLDDERTPYRYVSPKQLKFLAPKDFDKITVLISTQYIEFSNYAYLDLGFVEINKMTPNEGPPGTVVILEGRFSVERPNDRLKLILKDDLTGNIYTPPFEVLGPGKIKFTVPLGVTRNEYLLVTVQYYDNDNFKSTDGFFVKP